MDFIDSINLEPLSYCELNTKFNIKCHTDWSCSNLISVVSVDGIYILEPQLNNPNGPFRIELIRNPTQRFRHHILDNIRPTFDTDWSSLNQLQYMQVFLEPALNTHVGTLSTDLYPRRYRAAKWSPTVNTFPRQCLLATITVDYQLLIYKRKADVWVVEADLSSEYDRLWAQWQAKDVKNDTSKDKVDFEATKKDLNSLSFCNVCWKKTDTGNLILLAATIPGDIVVWQFNYLGTFSQSQNDDAQLDVRMILQTSRILITSMQLHENLLVVAANDGEVVLFDLTVNFNVLDSAAVPQTQQVIGQKILNLIPLPPTVTIWHRDNIEVADLYLQPISQDTFRIVLAKATNICWCIINYTKKNGKELERLAISDSFSAVDGKDPDVGLHKSPAIWLRPAGVRSAVLIADDGSFFQLEFVDDRQDTFPDFKVMNRDGRIDLTRLVPRGLCSSPSGNLIVMVSCISLMHETNKITSPAKLVLLPLMADKNMFAENIRVLLDEGWLASNNVTSPMDVCDRLDHLRATYPLLTVDQFDELYKILVAAIQAVGLPRDDVQLTKIKIVTFLLLKLFERDDSTMIEITQEDIKKAHELILLCNIRNTLAKTIFNDTAKVGEQCTELLSIQFTSLCNYFDWMDKSELGKEVRARYLDKYKVLHSKYAATFPHELCPICDAQIPFTSLKYGSCCNGHRFDRCSRSLLIINLQNGTELICKHCSRHYMKTLIWPTSNLWLCSHCQ